MKYIKTYLLLLLSFYGKGQDTTVIFTTEMAGKDGYIILGEIDGWVFRKGNDTNWANNIIDSSGWQKLKPSTLSKHHADKSGKLEGWLRLKFKIDTSFRDELLEIYPYTWAATDFYIDGKLMYNFGNTGANGKPFKEYNPSDKFPLPFSIEKGKEHLLAIHLVDFNSTLPPFRLKSDRLDAFMLITVPKFKNSYLKQYMENQNFWTIWVTINTILSFLFWLLTFLNRDEKNLPFIALASTLFALTVYVDQNGIVPVASYTYVAFLNIAWSLLLSISLIFSLLLMVRIFERKINSALKISFWVIGLSGVAQAFLYTRVITISIVSLTLFLLIYYIITSWKKLRGAQWAVQVGMLLAMAFGSALATSSIWAPDITNLGLWLFTGVCLSFPVSLALYVAMRFNEIIRDVRENAKRVIQLSEEKKEQSINQQKILQEEVNRQTIELRTSLENLKATQQQLIQTEKMASLGELTAGIAHEIQNPLNFVNNFSDVNTELVDEAKLEIDRGNVEEVKAILNDLKDNEQKINHHGKRADAIVKGMLQHSRTSSGQREPTDINVLADEYLRLAYHGLRAKDKSFNTNTKTDFDISVGNINVVPQELGRVILNLINNAFYAVDEKKKQNLNGYEPTVSVSTRKNNGKVEINVKDNGSGIPPKVLDKIFQPFFTTKPTGQGTGLGLSLAYDIITKGHGGELKVETKEGEGSKFSIVLSL